MNLIHTTFLTPLQKQDIHLLEFSCKQAEPLSLSAPTEDGLDYFLFYQDSRLAGMLYLFFSDPALCECSGFVLPDSRRQGIFSRLLECMTDFLEHLEDQTGEDIECCFLCDEAAPSAKSLLKALECELWYSEYKMECSLRAPYFFPCSAKEPTVSDSHPPLRLIQKDPDTFAAFLEDTEIGICQLHVRENHVYFYGFEIYKPYRKQGYGKQFLQEIMLRFSRHGYERMVLQVSGINLPALSLYQKTGFYITETLSYYWY